MDYPHDNSYRPGSVGSEVEQMKRKQTTKPIDSDKLKNLCLGKGHITVLSSEMGYSKDALSYAVSTGKISNQMALLLDKIHGIKYEDYKPEEPKPEPKEELKADPTQAGTVESQLRTISSQISHLNNNILALIELQKQIAFVYSRERK